MEKSSTCVPCNYCSPQIHAFSNSWTSFSVITSQNILLSVLMYSVKNLFYVLFSVCIVVWIGLSICPHNETGILHFVNGLFPMTSGVSWNVKMSLRKVWSICVNRKTIYANLHLIITLLAAHVGKTILQCQECRRNEKIQLLTSWKFTD